MGGDQNCCRLDDHHFQFQRFAIEHFDFVTEHDRIAHRFMTKLIRLIALSLLMGGAAFAADKPRNLLIITADDMNADSWFNCPVAATPTLDAFATTCYRFEQQHVSAPICQPSRSALMTGRVPHRNGALGFNPIRLDVPTLTEVLSSNGFFTAAVNKIQHMTPPSKFNWDVKFDGSGKNPPMMRADFEKCLKAAHDANKPFFINANITDPHRPFAGSRERNDEEQKVERRKKTKNEENAASVELYKPEQIIVPPFLEDIPNVRKEVAQYFSSVRRLDQTFTGLLAALKASGEEERTLIVFMSDHGMSFPYAKATIYRNGTWSPLLLRWKGMPAKPQINRTDMVSSVDVMPTVLDVLGVPKPPGLDGKSLVNLMQGKEPHRDYVFTHVNTVSSGKAFPGRCVRTKTKAYIWNSWPNAKTRFKVEAMSGLSFKALAVAAEKDPKIAERVRMYLYRTPEEFYDEEKDPSERHNLVKDPSCQADIVHFKKLLLEHMQKTDDPLLAQFLKVSQ
jgi:N-sulfoglucosamine sulfohydrolase